MIWFSSDGHFFHNSIIRLCNRPFPSVETMNETMVNNWNTKVKKGDCVYYIGDFSFGTYEQSLELFNKLNGQKFLIKGNHDRDSTLKLPWIWVKDIFNLKHNENSYVLCHYSMRTWNKSYHGARHLYGHSHNKLPPHGLSFDVGVDAWNFCPISINEVEEKMKTLTIAKEVYDD